MSKTLIYIGLAATLLVSAPTALASSRVAQTWRLHKIAEHGVVVFDAGTVNGAPFGAGTIKVKTTLLAGGRIALDFTQRLAHGSLTGTVRLGYAFNAAHTSVHYHGSGRLTGGTGRYSSDHQAIRLDGTGFPNADARITISG